MKGAGPDPPSPFPGYSLGERRADLAVHGLGLSLAALGLPWMVWSGFVRAGVAVGFSLLLYAVCAALMLGSSAVYNLTREPRRKELFRRIDRAAIFLMIAGTYSPLAVAKLGPVWREGLMAFEWGLAALGVTLAFAMSRRAERVCILLYLLMGWAVIPVTAPLMAAIGPAMFGGILAGALVYTAGVGLHAAVKLKYHNVLWHCCVLAAAVCHYAVILRAIAAPQTGTP